MGRKNTKNNNTKPLKGPTLQTELLARNPAQKGDWSVGPPPFVHGSCATVLSATLALLKSSCCYCLCFFDSKTAKSCPRSDLSTEGGPFGPFKRFVLLFFAFLFDPKPATCAPSRTSQQRGGPAPLLPVLLGANFVGFGSKKHKK